jgi:hypothetical protein
MSRPITLDADGLRRIRRDTRFQAALDARVMHVPEPRWRSNGLCLRADPEIFFPGSHDDPNPALAVCHRCPVSAACLAAALDAGDCDGVWGGTTASERRMMRQAWVSDRVV